MTTNDIHSKVTGESDCPIARVNETTSATLNPLADFAFVRNPLALAILDAKGTILLTNVAWSRLFQNSSQPSQTTAAQLIDSKCESLSSLVGAEDWALARKSMRLVLAGKTSEASEVETILSTLQSNATASEANIVGEPSTQIIGIRFERIPGESGESSDRLLALASDISDRKRTESALVEQQQILTHARGVLEEQKAELEIRFRQIEQSRTEANVARLEAENANRAKTDFLASFSHEIRTPMTAILGYADILLDPSINENQKVNSVQVIRRNGEHLLKLINDILDIAKIEAGKMMVENIDCSIEDIVFHVESLMRDLAASKKIGLTTSFQGPIPRVCKSDPTRLRQVLINLVGNAIKFTSQGSVQLVTSFETATSSADHLIRFDVIDTGIGLSVEQSAKLFEPFCQAEESTERRFGGTGLGLAISRRLAQLMGGDISIESEAGRGSTFTLRIAASNMKPEVYTPELYTPNPVHNRTVTNQVEAERSGLAHKTRSAAKYDGRVLLAEDGPDNQRLIRFQLSKLGIEVDVADNGLIAVQKFDVAEREGRPYQLVLMDMQMPELDGYAAARHLRARGWKGPIVALTAHAMAGDRERCLDNGCSDYLAKPIDRRELLRVLDETLGTSDTPPAAPPAKVLSLDHKDWTRRAALMQQLSVERRYDELRKELAEFRSLPDDGPESISRLAQGADASLRLRADLSTIHSTVTQLIRAVRTACQMAGTASAGKLEVVD